MGGGREKKNQLFPDDAAVVLAAMAVVVAVVAVLDVDVAAVEVEEEVEMVRGSASNVSMKQLNTPYSLAC